ncbi:SNF2 helicase associated domain-containing protein [Melissococcus plutonius]|uniref:SNF2 helicase associated domain-containing protein n=1 Tax=Melissococcus plutonius TaxID=33970 RepID=UPI003C2AD108
MRWSIPEKIIDRGREYVKEKRVIDIEQDIEKQVWNAEVLGDEIYHVVLDGTAREKDFCSCLYWDEYGFCEHTVAAELALKEQGKSRIITKTTSSLPIKKATSSITDMFTKGLFHEQQSKQTQETIPLSIDFLIETIETNNYYSEQSILGIALKIGYSDVKNAKMYIIKNIGEFLQIYKKRAVYSVNKQHAFLLAKGAFADDVENLLKELAEIYQTNQLLGIKGFPVKGKIEKRYLALPIFHGKELIKSIDQTGRLHFKISGTTFQHLLFSDEKLPLSFVITQPKSAIFQLTIEDPTTIFLSYYHWVIIDQTIYSLTDQVEKIYTTLRQLLKRLEEPSIFYDSTQVSELFSRILPILKQIGHVQLDKTVKNQLAFFPLHAVFYFRKHAGMIKVRVDFYYGETLFSTNKRYTTKKVEDQEIIRDIQKENAIMDVFQQFGYAMKQTEFEKKLPAGEALYHFFARELPSFRKLGTVKVGEQLSKLFLKAENHQPLISVSETTNWLNVKFDISGIDEKEVDAVLTNLMKKRTFYTLESGEILSLKSEEFNHTSQVLTALRKKTASNKQTIQVPKNQGLIIEEILGKDKQAAFSTSFKQMVFYLTHPEKFAVQLPKGIKASLRHYQVEGFYWLKMLSHYQLGGILSDEMGLGKTLQTITYLLSEKEEGKQKSPALIVAPASLIYNWIAEIKKFSPTTNVQIIFGNKDERIKLLANAEKQDILITSYASLRQDVEQYKEIKIDYLILDEAQMVKNSGTKTAKALRSLEISKKFALSGTPIENNLEELWSIFQLILPGLLPSKMIFRKMRANDIAKVIQPFILRRDKQTVLSDLPEKIESNLYSVLTEEQKTIYLAYLKQMQADIQKMDQATFKKNRLNILAGLTRLRQICCDPRLFIEDYTGGSSKVEQVKEILITAKKNNKRVLLFSQFKGMLSILEKEFQRLDLETFYLSGSTKPKERINMVNAFNDGQKDVFLISLKAGGTGLNLTGADTVILYDLWWNPAVEEQAASRAHRIGQKKVVEVWRMITEGTIEEKIDSLQHEKRALFQQVIQGNEEQLARLTEDDIRNILNIGM